MRNTLTIFFVVLSLLAGAAAQAGFVCDNLGTSCGEVAECCCKGAAAPLQAGDGHSSGPGYDPDEPVCKGTACLEGVLENAATLMAAADSSVSLALTVSTISLILPSEDLYLPARPGPLLSFQRPPLYTSNCSFLI